MMDVCLDAPCPLVDGIHFWVWPGGRSEGWKTAQAQADRVLEYGGVGVIPQAGLSSLAWLEGKDSGQSAPRHEIFDRAGLQVTAGYGLDSKSATREAISGVIIRTLDLPRIRVMSDWEIGIKWETKEGRLLASQIDDDVLNHDERAYLRCVDCPWWKPNVHRGAPTVIFWKLFLHRFVQAYGAHGIGKPDETEWMLAEARREYPALGIAARYVHGAEQMYGHSLAAAGALVLSAERVLACWDIEEADKTFLAALLARVALKKNGFAQTIEGLKAFQRAASIPSTGILDLETLRPLHVNL